LSGKQPCPLMPVKKEKEIERETGPSFDSLKEGKSG